MNKQKLFMLSDEAIKEFQKIWKEEFGEEISDTEASIRGVELIELFQLIAPKEEDLIKLVQKNEKNNCNPKIKKEGTKSQ